MNELNQQLRELYLSEQEAIEMFSDKCTKAWIDGGNDKEESWFIYQLAYATEKYCHAKIKILIVGQETYGWGVDAFCNIEKSMLGTNDFQTASNYNNSPFWQFIKELSSSLNGEEYYTMDSVAWTNLFKLSNDKLPTYIVKSNHELAQEYCKSFQTLKKEIEILKPDMVVFTTGPNYDYWLQQQFDGVQYLSVIDEMTNREFARLSHKSLPTNTFRVYHPGYMNRDKENRWNPVVARLKVSIE